MPLVMPPEDYTRHTEEIAGFPVEIISYRLWQTYYAKAEIALPGMRGWISRAEASTQGGAEARAIAEAWRLLNNRN